MSTTILNRVRRLLRPGLPDIVGAVHDENLSYLGLRALTELHAAVRGVEARGAEGILVEAGCALGGSAIVMAAAKAPDRPLYVFDVFDMIPPPSQSDGEDIQHRYEEIRSGRSQGIGGDTYYGYQDDLLDRVTASFQRHELPVESSNVHLVKGLFEETMHVDQPVALAHLDGDWYESVRTCLVRLVPKLVPGGVLIIDDYDAWSGCRRAVDEYFADRMNDFRFVHQQRLHIVRSA